jgi:hypothetical protein
MRGAPGVQIRRGAPQSPRSTIIQAVERMSLAMSENFAPAQGSAGRAALRPFVGRARELEELRAALDDAGEGRGRLFLVSGEPGIGKTHLLLEVSRSDHGRGLLPEGGRGRRQHPLRRALRVLDGRHGVRGFGRVQASASALHRARGARRDRPAGSGGRALTGVARGRLRRCHVVRGRRRARREERARPDADRRAGSRPSSTAARSPPTTDCATARRS